jgi:hypothetical protein
MAFRISILSLQFYSLRVQQVQLGRLSPLLRSGPNLLLKDLRRKECDVKLYGSYKGEPNMVNYPNIGRLIVALIF